MEEKSQLTGVGVILMQQAAKNNPAAEESPPGPGKQPQLLQKMPRTPSWVPQSKCLWLSQLLLATRSPYNTPQRVKCSLTVATPSFLWLLALLPSIPSPLSHPLLPQRLSTCACRQGEHFACWMALWLNGQAGRGQHQQHQGSLQKLMEVKIQTEQMETTK